MKKVAIFLVVVFLILFPLSCQTDAAEVTLAWDPNSEEDLAGYKIHWGTESGNYSLSVDVGNVTIYTLKDLTPGLTYYLAATAYDTNDNESAYSIELTYTVYTLPDAGKGLRHRPL